MSVTINKDILIEITNKTIFPFINILKDVLSNFNDLFDVIESPELPDDLLSSLEHEFVFHLLNFKNKTELEYTILLSIEFNKSDYHIGLNLINEDYNSLIKLKYDDIFDDKKQTSNACQLGLHIISLILANFVDV